MIILRGLRGRDSVSKRLLATGLIALFAALAVAPRSSPPAIPERLLERVRGANPAYYRSVNQYPNCTALNVYNANSIGGRTCRITVASQRARRVCSAQS
jgi:hypothetical protein